MQLMGGSSLLAKATTALQAAAAKADRALTEFKADFKADSSKGVDGRRELPALGEAEDEKPNDGGFRQRVVPKKPEKDFMTAGAVIEGDEELKAQDFWKRYFSAVKTMKQDFLDKDSEVAVVDEPEMIVEANCMTDSNTDSSKDYIDDEDYKAAFSVVAIPPSLLLRRLAAAVESGKASKSMKLSSQRSRSLDKENPSNSSEWTGLVTGLAMVRKLSSKDGKFRGGSYNNRGCYHAMLFDLFEAEALFDVKEAADETVSPTKRMRLPEGVHGAPPDSFVAKLAELTGGMKSEQKMTEFWLQVVRELRRRWISGEPVPRMPIDASPDLRYCSIHQQLQLINCCIARRKRRASTLATLHESQSNSPEDHSRWFLDSDGTVTADGLYAKQTDGRLLLRVGADYPAEDLRMLETGEMVYSPLTQEDPVFTEDSIREAEELVLRTGSVGAGCSHLLSDMQAFKAANPGCILEDFVRWYSPPDWREDPEVGFYRVNGNGSFDASANEPSLKGYLSARMQAKGNLWQELWSSARPIPAVSQSPLFDEELAGESTLDALESLPPTELFKQLFTAAFSVGYALVEGSEAAKEDPLRGCLAECSDIIMAMSGDCMSRVTMQQLCQAYEAMEAAIFVPLEDDQETPGRPWLSSLKAFRVVEKN